MNFQGKSAPDWIRTNYLHSSLSEARINNAASSVESGEQGIRTLIAPFKTQN